MRQLKVTSKTTDTKLASLSAGIEQLLQSRSKAIAEISRLEAQAQASYKCETDQPDRIEDRSSGVREELLDLEKSLERHRSQHADLQNTLLQPLAECLDRVNGKAATYTLDAVRRQSYLEN